MLPGIWPVPKKSGKIEARRPARAVRRESVFFASLGIPPSAVRCAIEAGCESDFLPRLPRSAFLRAVKRDRFGWKRRGKWSSRNLRTQSRGGSCVAQKLGGRPPILEGFGTFDRERRHRRSRQRRAIVTYPLIEYAISTEFCTARCRAPGHRRRVDDSASGVRQGRAVLYPH